MSDELSDENLEWAARDLVGGAVVTICGIELNYTYNHLSYTLGDYECSVLVALLPGPSRATALARIATIKERILQIMRAHAVQALSGEEFRQCLAEHGIHARCTGPPF